MPKCAAYSGIQNVLRVLIAVAKYPILICSLFVLYIYDICDPTMTFFRKRLRRWTRRWRLQEVQQSLEALKGATEAADVGGMWVMAS